MTARGKTTHTRFLERSLREHGLEVVCLREPGGTEVGEALRRVVLDPAHESLSDEAELLIYEAARAQIVAEVIRPALDRSAVVLCDRFFDSTIAYQVFGRGLDRDFVERRINSPRAAFVPDRTLLMVCGGARRGLGRVASRRRADRLELAGPISTSVWARGSPPSPSRSRSACASSIRAAHVRSPRL